MARLNDPRFNIKLVKLIKQHPCLYNHKLPEYSRKDISDEAWSQIAQQVNESVSVCKEKWKNIRTVFVRHLKTGTTSSTPPSKTRPKSKLRRPYYMKNLMEFLAPFIKTNPPTLDTVRAIEAEEDNQTSVDIVKTEIEMDTEYEDYEEFSTDRNEIQPETESTKSFQNITNECVNCRNSKTELDESRKLFLLSLLPELNQMNNQQMKRFKRNVLVLIDDILEENVQEKPCFQQVFV